ncbi:MAG: hypothetical protein Ct9H90mP5_09230 [Acidimicrobiaceae bacterium]|nr:MAG: hypothetical protein Ct9H90mP5_09230 [Acidimicrobiaceae bacterium]
MLTSTRVLLLSFPFFSVSYFSFLHGDIRRHKEDLLFGTHKDITCPANYQSISLTETGTVCQKNTYVCDPIIHFKDLKLPRKTEISFSMHGNASSTSKDCHKRADVMPSDQSKYLSNSNCYIIIQHSSERKRYLLQVVLLKVMKSTDVLSLTHKIINGTNNQYF